MLKKSLQIKFIFLIASILVIIFSIGGFLVASNNLNKTRDSLTQQAVAFSQLSTKPLADAYNLYFNSGYIKFREVFQETSKLDKNISQVQLIDVNGKVIFDSKKMGVGDYPENNPVTVDQATLEKVVSGEPVYATNPKDKQEIIEIFNPYFSDWGSHPYTARYFVSYEEVKTSTMQIIFQTAILFFASFLVVTFIIGASVSRLIIHPISVVSDIAKKISQGKYGKRVEIKSEDEIGELADATNKMAKKLEQDIFDLKELDRLKDEFVDIAAHNLKIPLNHLKYDVISLNAILDNKVNNKSIELIKDIEINSNKLQILSEDLINVTAIKKGTLENNIFMPVDLVKIVNEAIDDMATTMAVRKIKIEKKMIDSAIILGDSQKLKQLFLILIDNAIIFSRSDSNVIKVGIEKKRTSFIVYVKDNGVGIAKEEMSKLFQKFYRAPSSAKYNKEGAGLGLFLAKLIAEVHHGSIWAESEIGKGSTFFTSFPEFRTLNHVPS